jgi:mutator protein MutT
MISSKICSLVFLLRNDEILLAMKKRGFGEGYYNGLGGKVEPGETMEQALVRETQEEIGVTPLSWDKVAVHDFIMDADGEEPWHMHVHAFVCREWEGEPVETEEMAPQWFKVSEIPYDKMWDDDIVWLPQVLRGHKVRTTFHFNLDNTMKSAELTIIGKLEDEIPAAP